MCLVFCGRSFRFSTSQRHLTLRYCPDLRKEVAQLELTCLGFQQAVVVAAHDETMPIAL